MTHRKSFWFFIWIFSLGSCVWDWGDLTQTDPASIIQQSNLEDSVEENREGDSRRRLGSSGSYSRRGGKCRNDNSCADICEDLFDDAGVVENCLDLSISIVKGRGTKRKRGFEYILDVFDSRITYPALTNIDGVSFKALMELSVEHWVNLTDDVTETEAKALLAWIAADKSVAEVIREHGADGNYAGFNSYEGLIRLMKEVGNKTGCDEYKDALTSRYLTGRFTFCCIALRERNSEAVAFVTGVHVNTETTPSNDIVGDINRLENCRDRNDIFACPANGGDNCPGGG